MFRGCYPQYLIYISPGRGRYKHWPSLRFWIHPGFSVLVVHGIALHYVQYLIGQSGIVLGTIAPCWRWFVTPIPQIKEWSSSRDSCDVPWLPKLWISSKQSYCVIFESVINRGVASHSSAPDDGNCCFSLHPMNIGVVSACTCSYCFDLEHLPIWKQ